MWTRELKGRVAEAVVLTRLAELDVDVFQPAFGSPSADFVVQIRRSGKLQKVQVKWLKKMKYGSVLKITRSNGRKKFRKYFRREIDILVGYDHETKTCFVYTFSELSHLKYGVTVGDAGKEQWNKLLL